jgi:carotenoid cleavage dioxygenase-like enzyme
VAAGDLEAAVAARGWTPVRVEAYRIRLEEGLLGLVEPRSLRGLLEPRGPDAFRRGPMTFRFDRDEDGAVTHLEVGTGRAFGIRFVPTARDPDGG